jgi:hypothetical protein
MEGISSSFASATSAPSKHDKDDDDFEFDDDSRHDLSADENEINHETNITLADSGTQSHGAFTQMTPNDVHNLSNHAVSVDLLHQNILLEENVHHPLPKE